MTDMYADPNTLTTDVSKLAISDDMYLQIDAADPSKQTLEPVIPPRATRLIEQFADEDLYLRPQPGSASTEWYDVEAQKNGYYKDDWYYGEISREKAERLVVDQAQGRFLVRVSKKKKTKNYAITVAMGLSNYLHVAIILQDSGEVTIDGVNFPSLRAAITHFSSTKYKNIVQLTKPIIQITEPVATSQAKAPPLPDRSAPMPPPRVTAGNAPENAYAKLDFESDHIYASTISSDEDDEDGVGLTEEDVYLAPAAARSDFVSPPRETRKNTVKLVPLPTEVSMWTAAEVQRFLKNNGLTAFKKPFYANGVTGVELVTLKGKDFPKARFSQAQCDAFDAALATAQSRGPQGQSLPQSAVSSASQATPPPVPGRPSRMR